MSRYQTGNKQYCMVVSGSEILLYISLLCVQISHPAQVCSRCFVLSLFYVLGDRQINAESQYYISIFSYSTMRTYWMIEHHR